MNLDEVHDILEQLDLVGGMLSRTKAKTINIEDFPAMVFAVNEVLGWDRTAYTDMPARLGVNVSILSKFTHLKGSISTTVARKLIDRLRTYVRSLDQTTLPTPDEAAPTEQQSAEPKLEPFKFPGEQWAMVQLSSNMKLKIAAVSSLLDTIVLQIQRTNAPPGEQILTELERKQLIAVLETVLVVLKAPVLEKGLLQKARDVLAKASRSAAEKQVQEGIGDLATLAGRGIAEIIKAIFS